MNVRLLSLEKLRRKERGKMKRCEPVFFYIWSGKIRHGEVVELA
jgi:phage terminase large subunit-like protein